MTSQRTGTPTPGDERGEAMLADRAARDTLRILVCGGGGAGKSTLTASLGGDASPADKAQAGHEKRSANDIVYRAFSSQTRSYFVGDTPGHEEYTREIVTQPAGFDLAVLVVDAPSGVTKETHRHVCILDRLGLRNILLAVNKMDLAGYSRERFDEIVVNFTDFAAALGLDDVSAIPVCATGGDNIMARGKRMQWYDGPAFLAYLDNMNPISCPTSLSFRMPVQSVDQADAKIPSFAGTIASGVLRVGDEITVLPAGVHARVARIVTIDGNSEEAHAGDALTLTVAGSIDVSRGDVVCARNEEATVSDQIGANVFWMGDSPMLPGRRYILKSGSQSVAASITDLKYILNVDTLEHQAGKTLARDELGYCNLSLDHALVFDPYQQNRIMGAFILVDTLTDATVGAGTIEFGLRRATNIRWQALEINKGVRATLKKQKPCVLWFTGLSGSGKSTLASLLEKQLHARGRHTYVLDGDNVRHGLNKDLGFTDADRVENIRRVAETARLFVDAGLIVLVSFISPFRSERLMARELFEAGEFLEVFVDTPLEVCEQRDPKGLYKKARAGEIKNFTGIDSAYEQPERADIVLAAGIQTPEALVKQLMADLEANGFI